MIFSLSLVIIIVIYKWVFCNMEIQQLRLEYYNVDDVTRIYVKKKLRSRTHIWL